MVATRPLLLSVLKERLERLGQQEDDWQSFLSPTKALISKGIKSAMKTLQILSDEDSLLGKYLMRKSRCKPNKSPLTVFHIEIFLPFEMEVTYGAALHLMMANTLFSHATESAEYSVKAHAILDEMIFKGNRLAAARKTELSHLEGLFHELAMRIKHYGLQELFLTTPEHTEPLSDITAHHLAHAEPSVANLQTPDTYEMHGYPSNARLPNGVELLDDIGISSYEFLSIIEQIGGADSSVLDPQSLS